MTYTVSAQRGITLASQRSMRKLARLKDSQQTIAEMASTFTYKKQQSRELEAEVEVRSELEGAHDLIAGQNSLVVEVEGVLHPGI